MTDALLQYALRGGVTTEYQPEEDAQPTEVDHQDAGASGDADEFDDDPPPF